MALAQDLAVASPRKTRVHLYLLASFLPAIAFAFWRYDLWLLDHELRYLDFERIDARGHILASDLSFGYDYLLHVVTGFLAFHNVGVFLSRRYRESEIAPAVLVLVVSIAYWWVLRIFLPPHGVLADYVDDVLIYVALLVALANLVVSAFFVKGRAKAIPMTAGLAMMAFFADNAMCHVVFVEPSVRFLRHQRDWMADAVAKSGKDVDGFCRKSGFVCVTRGPDGQMRPITPDPGPHISADVVNNVLAAAAKYRVLDARIPVGTAFDIRHGALTTDMGLMRYTGFRVATSDGSTVVAIDGLSSPSVMLWFHTFFAIHIMMAGAIWIVLIGYVAKTHQRQEDRS